MQRHLQTVETWARHAVDWANHAETWRVVLAVAAVLLILPLLPVVPALLLALAILAAIVAFGRTWLDEFGRLMALRDDAFPGASDKLIWAVLMIVLPPVGAYLFRSYRLAHWPEAKPRVAPAAHDLT